MIWIRRLAKEVDLPAARRNILVLYRSADRRGNPVAVSGTIAIPRGRPPRRGWPVISWSYGYTGVADRCAPSRGWRAAPHRPYLEMVMPALNRWVKAGYAVVATDYHGPHPPASGIAAARNVLDLVRAARRVRRSIGRRFVLAGHSGGGLTALWANGRSLQRTPRLRLRGTVSYAPFTRPEGTLRALPFFTDPAAIALAVQVIVRGIDIEYPGLGVSELFTERFAALYPDTANLCFLELVDPSGPSGSTFLRPSWIGLTGADVFRPGVDLEPLALAATTMNPVEAGIRGHLRIRGDVLVVWGVHDPIPAPTALLDHLADKPGVTLDYRTYEADHVPVLKSLRDVTKWIRSRLR